MKIYIILKGIDTTRWDNMRSCVRVDFGAFLSRSFPALLCWCVIWCGCCCLLFFGLCRIKFAPVFIVMYVFLLVFIEVRTRLIYYFNFVRFAPVFFCILAIIILHSFFAAHCIFFRVIYTYLCIYIFFFYVYMYVYFYVTLHSTLS